MGKLGVVPPISGIMGPYLQLVRHPSCMMLDEKTFDILIQQIKGQDKQKRPPTWRIILFSKRLITMVSKIP